MKVSTSWSRSCMLFVVAILLTGCETLRSLHHHEETAQEEAIAQFILVGGEVQQPGQIPLSERGISLREALSLAGGIRRDAASFVPASSEISPASLAETLSNLDTLIGLAAAETRIVAQLKQACVSAPNSEIVALRASLNRASIDRVKFEKEKLRAVEARLDPASELVNAARRRFVEAECSSADFGAVEKAYQDFGAAIDQLKTNLQSGRAPNRVAPAIRATEAFLVGVRRTNDSQRATYYYPYESITAGSAGSIRLEHDDFINVVPASETTLLNPRTTPGDNYSVSGFVQSAGDKTIEAEQQQGGASPLQLQQVVSEQQFSEDRLDRAKMSVVLSRSSADGLGRDVFVIPFQSASEHPYDSMPSVAADIYKIVPTFRAPLIIESVVNSIIDEQIYESILRQHPNARGVRGHLLEIEKAKAAMSRGSQSAWQQLTTGF